MKHHVLAHLRVKARKPDLSMQIKAILQQHDGLYWAAVMECIGCSQQDSKLALDTLKLLGDVR